MGCSLSSRTEGRQAPEVHYLPKAFPRRAATAPRVGLGGGRTLERTGAHFPAKLGPKAYRAPPALRAGAGHVISGGAAGRREHGIGRPVGAPIAT